MLTTALPPSCLALLQMDERGQHGPAARRGIGPAEGIGFAVGDEIAERPAHFRCRLSAEVEGNVLAQLAGDLAVSHDLVDIQVEFAVTRLGAAGGHDGGQRKNEHRRSHGFPSPV